MPNKGLGDILLKYITKLFDKKLLSKGRSLLKAVGPIVKDSETLLCTVYQGDYYKVRIPTLSLPKHSAQFFRHRYVEEIKKPPYQREFFHLGDGSKVDQLFNSYSGHLYGKSKCSCPSSDVICPHILAVIFTIIADLDENDETLFALFNNYDTQKYSEQEAEIDKDSGNKTEENDYVNPEITINFQDLLNTENAEHIPPLAPETISADDEQSIPSFKISMDKILDDLSLTCREQTLLYFRHFYNTSHENAHPIGKRRLAINFDGRICIYYPRENLFGFRKTGSNSEVKISPNHLSSFLDSYGTESAGEEDTHQFLLLSNLAEVYALSRKILSEKCFLPALYIHSNGAKKAVLRPHPRLADHPELEKVESLLSSSLFHIESETGPSSIKPTGLLDYLLSVFLTNTMGKSMKDLSSIILPQMESKTDKQLARSLWLNSEQTVSHYTQFVKNMYKPYPGIAIEMKLNSYDLDLGFDYEIQYRGNENGEERKLKEEYKASEKYLLRLLEYFGFVKGDATNVVYHGETENIAYLKPYLLFYDIDVQAPDSLFEPRKLEMQEHWEVLEKGQVPIDTEVEITLLDNEKEQLNISQLQHLSNSGTGVYELNSEFYHIDESVLKIIRKYLEKKKVISGTTMFRSVLMEKHNEKSIKLGDKLQGLKNELFEIEDCEIPEEFQGVLRPYQIEGLSWLWKNSQMGLGSLLADDMGLGKTIQLLALIAALKKESPSLKALIVVPTAVISNWLVEGEKFVPNLDIMAYYGSDREPKALNDDKIIITSYGMVRSDHLQLREYKWDLLALDEAQKIKNPNTKISKVIKTLRANVKIALTGTPVENRLLEYWNILDFLNEGILGTKSWFKRQFANPIEKDQSKDKLELFTRICAPFIMRRLKTDKNIISDLPEKIVSDEFCTLSNRQKNMYSTYVSEMLELIEGKTGIHRKGLILKLMTDLKKICNHPRHYNPGVKGNPESGKLNYLMNILNIIKDNNEKALLFTQYVEMGYLLQEIAEKELGLVAGFYHGKLKRKKRDKVLQGFKKSQGFDLLIISLKAGGTGLNLTEASHVIHYDLWWNPAVEDQATDRAFRIGQDKNVYVQRLISKGTFEEKIDKMLQAKRGLADSVLNVKTNWIGNLSDDELEELFYLEDVEEPIAENLV